MRYIPKVWLKLILPDGKVIEGFFHKPQVLRDIIVGFGAEGEAFLEKKKLNADKNIGELNLKNDDIITIV